MNILIIGGTGFIGQRLVRKLHQEGQKIFLLVRPASFEKAKKLFQELSDIQFLRGDIENMDLLSDVSQTEKVSEEIDCLVHLAAAYRLDISSHDAYIQNVIGTQNVLKFLSRLKRLKSFYYFSTYAVNQLLNGEITEDQLVHVQTPFFDEYAKSKNQAEHLVRELSPKNIKTVILRPGIIVGDSHSGEHDKSDGPYYFFNFIQQIKKLGKIADKIRLLPLPVEAESLMPVLPVNVLIDWTTQIILNPIERTISCYHLIPKSRIRTKDFLQLSIDLLGSPLKIVSFPITSLFPPAFKLLQLPKELVFYMKQKAFLDRTQLEKDYPYLQEPFYQDYLPNLIQKVIKDQR
jgi:thioester reductase-like protein